jgi:hypothetical protein
VNNPVVSYVHRRPPQAGDQLRVTVVDSDAAGLAVEGEIVTVSRVEHTADGLFLFVESPAGLRRFRWAA